MNEFKGFSLFNDIEDAELRNRNRAVVMANIAKDHNRNGLINAAGAALIIGYFDRVPQVDRGSVLKTYVQRMYEEGFKIEQQGN